VEAYRKVVEVLPRFQAEAGCDLNYDVCYPIGSFDRQSIAWDLNTSYYFLRLAGIPFSEQALENDFGRLTDFLLSAPRDYFLYRDFHRAIFSCATANRSLSIIRGRKGALQYDIRVSFVRCQGGFARGTAQELLDHISTRLAVT